MISSLTKRIVLSGIAVAGLTGQLSHALTVVYDSGGFEAPRFAPGALEGQDPVNGPWVRTAGAGSASVQSGTVASGTQAVQLNRAGQDIRFAVSKPINNVGLSPEPIITVDWSMNYVASNLPPGSFGPYLGVEVYDGSGPVPLLAASAGVDADTGELLFQQPGTGFIDVVPGVVIAASSWHTFGLELNYTTQSYRLFFDGTPVLTSGFVTPGITDFTDASISALAAGGDPASQNAAGSAFFDNFRVNQVPEPGVPALVVVVGLAISGRRVLSR